MLGTYQPAKFVIPENPVMRAVTGLPILAQAPPESLSKNSVKGMGCAGECGCKSKVGMGNVCDEGLRLYGDWYGAQQHGGMVLNGDRNGLGTYFPSDAHDYRGFSGLGDLETMFSNFTQGNYGAALSGNDIASSLPNWIVVGGVVWFLMTINSQQGKVRKSASKFMRARRAARSEA